MMVIRRSVTGSRLAAASSVVGLRSAGESSVSSPTHPPSDWPFVSAVPSNGCSRKEEDRSGVLVRLAGCCLRKTLKTLIRSPSPTKSMSPCSLRRSFKASLTEFLAFCASVRRTESFEDLSTSHPSPSASEPSLWVGSLWSLSWLRSDLPCASSSCSMAFVPRHGSQIVNGSPMVKTYRHGLRADGKLVGYASAAREFHPAAGRSHCHG